MEISQTAFYLPVDGGQCFCVFRRPRDSGASRGAILHLPAFAEEMNKARRMTALAARRFAASGYCVLQVDPIGCGDSSGDFGDATLTMWAENCRAAAQWLRRECALEFWIWPLRAGALLVAPLFARLEQSAHLLLWQPVVSGAQILTQFLRLRAAAEMFAAPAEGESTTALRERLKNGESLDVAGYRISPTMAAELEHADLTIVANASARIAWLEVQASAKPRLSPVAQSRLESLRRDGIRCDARAVQGPGFWQSVEIEECGALIDASAAAIADDLK